MYVFIATIFIAELIIAGFIIYWLNRFGKIISSVIQKAAEAEIMTISTIKQSRKVLKSAQKFACNYVDFFVTKKNEIRKKILHLVLMYLFLVVFKTKFKNAATILQYVILFKDFWKSIPV